MMMVVVVVVVLIGNEWTMRQVRDPKRLDQVLADELQVVTLALS